MATPVNEQAIMDSLRLVPIERWNEVLDFLDTIRDADPAIRTGADLSQSSLVGLWSDRDDLGDGRGFAQKLRRQAESRPGAVDAAGH